MKDNGVLDTPHPAKKYCPSAGSVDVEKAAGHPDITDVSSLSFSQLKLLLHNASRLNYWLIVTGWLLSPFTPYNDPIVNIPLAWFIAEMLWATLGLDPKGSMVACYWGTNALGLLLLAFGLSRHRRRWKVRIGPVLRELGLVALISIAIYFVLTSF